MPSPFKFCINKASATTLKTMYRKLNSHSGGVIGVNNSDGSEPENRISDRMLLAYLKGQGYSVASVTGTSFGRDRSRAEEPSTMLCFLVINEQIQGDDFGALETDLMQVGALLNQEAIVSIRFRKLAILKCATNRSNALLCNEERFKMEPKPFCESVFELVSCQHAQQFDFIEVSNVDSPTSINDARASYELAKNLKKQLNDFT